jgi:hypothetical protein
MEKMKRDREIRTKDHLILSHWTLKLDPMLLHTLIVPYKKCFFNVKKSPI